MERQEILKWLDKYDREEDQQDRDCERELGNVLRRRKELSKVEFLRLLDWKFGSYPARLKRERSLAGGMTDDFVRNTIRTALNTGNDFERIETLFELKGVKNAVASVILSFYDPKVYGVFDIHAWRELFGKEPKDFSSKPENLVMFLGRLREIASQLQMDAREVEKALFKKNYDESRAKPKAVE